MRKLALLLVLNVATFFGQPVIDVQNANATQTSVKPGDPISLNVVLSGGNNTNAGLQFSVSVPAGFTFTAAAGAHSTQASKTVQCNFLPASSKELCIIYGINQTTIADGGIAVLNSTVPAAQSSGNLTFTVADTLGSDPTGTAVAVSAATPFVLPVVIPVPISPCDLNGDGKTDSSDVTIAANQFLGLASGTSADLNQDGVVTVADLYRIVVAALGGSCRVGP